MEAGIGKISGKTGIKAPGSFVPVGANENTPSTFVISVISETAASTKSVKSLEEDLLLHPEKSTLWVDIQGFSDLTSLQKLFSTLKIHPLLQEDILNTKHRPKVETIENSLLIITKLLTKTKKSVYSGHMAFLLGQDYILTFQPAGEDNFKDTRNHLGELKYPYTHIGYVFYSLLDNLIDRHSIVLEHLYDRIERLETRLLNYKDETPPQEEIVRLKHEVSYARRIILPLQKFVGDLRDNSSKYFLPGIEPYLADLRDNIDHVSEYCEVCHESITMIIQINSENINIRANEIMKVLAAVSAIFLPLACITGIYGMNFAYMPELKSPWGYPICLTFMGVIALYLYRSFKSRKWF